jgi:hypothetical protein
LNSLHDWITLSIEEQDLFSEIKVLWFQGGNLMPHCRCEMRLALAKKARGAVVAAPLGLWDARFARAGRN